MSFCNLRQALSLSNYDYESHFFSRPHPFLTRSFRPYIFTYSTHKFWFTSKTALLPAAYGFAPHHGFPHEYSRHRFLRLTPQSVPASWLHYFLLMSQSETEISRNGLRRDISFQISAPVHVSDVVLPYMPFRRNFQRLVSLAFSYQRRQHLYLEWVPKSSPKNKARRKPLRNYSGGGASGM